MSEMVKGFKDYASADDFPSKYDKKLQAKDFSLFKTK
jgi:hypothetical protein